MTRDMTNYNMRWIEDDPMPVEDKAPISAREKIERQRRQLHKEREGEGCCISFKATQSA
jgi:hypothetical protein